MDTLPLVAIASLLLFNLLFIGGAICIAFRHFRKAIIAVPLFALLSGLALVVCVGVERQLEARGEREPEPAPEPAPVSGFVPETLEETLREDARVLGEELKRAGGTFSTQRG